MKRIIRAAESIFYGKTLNEDITLLGKMSSKLAYRDPRKRVLEDAGWLFKRIREALSDKNMENLIKDYEIHTGGMGWEVDHAPIDETRTEDGEWHSYEEHWGLDTFFEELSKDSEEYKKLYKCYELDEPLYIGKARIPTTWDIALHIEIVYVVRCYNNGTTYFTSSNKEALQSFTW